MASLRSKASHRKTKPICIISACLTGINCTYRGGNKLNPRLKRLVAEGWAIAVCPEVMGGLTIPRENAEISGGDGAFVLIGRARVISRSGKDLSASYISGSMAVLDIVKRNHITSAILKSKSPACGLTHIYDGTCRNVLKKGKGVLASLLLDHGIAVEEE